MRALNVLQNHPRYYRESLVEYLSRVKEVMTKQVFERMLDEITCYGFGSAPIINAPLTRATIYIPVEKKPTVKESFCAYLFCTKGIR